MSEDPARTQREEDLKPFEYTTRLDFLYRSVSDAQETIRFLDTKAAFCVTLLSAMMAAAFTSVAQNHHPHSLHWMALAIFAVTTLLTLALCLKVIFPTIHSQGAFSATGLASPAFFLPHKKSRHRLLKSLWNTTSYPLGVTHDEHRESVVNASDMDLVHSMCDEVITVSVLRQVKSDRLRLAIVGLMLAVFFFFVQLIL
jgi:hypothetical protein